MLPCATHALLWLVVLAGWRDAMQPPVRAACGSMQHCIRCVHAKQEAPSQVAAAHHEGGLQAYLRGCFERGHAKKGARSLLSAAPSSRAASLALALASPLLLPLVLAADLHDLAAAALACRAIWLPAAAERRTHAERIRMGWCVAAQAASQPSEENARAAVRSENGK